jgi:glycosyltransferase involved in cell wall biosynthesis
VISEAGSNSNLSQRDAEVARLLKPISLDLLCETPLVSVLTGNYNYAGFLGEAIASVLAQTYSNFEMIVCDDGSTDNSCDVVERYANDDPRVRLIKKRNGGQGSAWNAAYRECKGEIICFLDADDRFLPEKLMTVVQTFRSQPSSGFIGHRVYRINASGAREGVVPATDDPPSGWHGPLVVRSGASPPAMSFGSGLCLRRKIGDAVFPIPEELKICADEAITTLGPLMTPLIGIPVPLAEYRYHGRNVWNSSDVSLESRKRITEIHRRMWELSREYVDKVAPELMGSFPAFDACRGTLLNTYMEKRLQSWSGSLSAYRNLVNADAFHTMRPAWRWFWSFSILLPQPFFRFAIGEKGLRQLVWKAREARRKLLPT